MSVISLGGWRWVWPVVYITDVATHTSCRCNHAGQEASNLKRFGFLYRFAFSRNRVETLVTRNGISCRIHWRRLYISWKTSAALCWHAEICCSARLSSYVVVTQVDGWDPVQGVVFAVYVRNVRTERDVPNVHEDAYVTLLHQQCTAW